MPQSAAETGGSHAQTRLMLTSHAPVVARVVVAVIVFLIPFLRQPDLIEHPQLYAEDGLFIYADGYNLGWFRAVLLPIAGSMQVLSRLVAVAAAPFPLRAAPFAFVLVSLVLDSVPAVAFLSNRFNPVVASYPVRAAMAMLVQAMPNSWELFGTATNLSWHIGLLAALLIITAVPQGLATRIADAAAIVIAGTSGPFAVLLAPLAVIQWLRDRSRWRLAMMAVLLALVVVQAVVLVDYLVTPVAYGPQPTHAGLLGQLQGIGATPGRFVDILSARVFLVPVIGTANMAALMTRHSWLDHAIPVVIDLLAMAAIGWAIVRGTPELRLFLLFAGLVLAVSLVRPGTNVVGGWWPLIVQPILAPRYFYVPMLAWLGVLVWMAVGQRFSPARIAAGAALVATLFIGIPSDWVLPQFPTSSFMAEAAAFESAPVGETAKIDTSPPGWFMVLTKH